ncbi:MAG: hypothetical protein HY852_11080 [Bradyrhizobium sp.]|uniref:hypothetical protein n=1 Tax=Bradyrhizobium sp. TaxID=376 RepID=UPI0025C13275|nr:hypothetical protein [Bradyrhizobium sp.]MBI5262345.1 hypothetical protein [Bradyrhizobium sp.]
MTDHYDCFAIDSFEAEGAFGARIRRAGFSLVALDGVLFPALETGSAWPSPEAAIADARQRIDDFRRR